MKLLILLSILVSCNSAIIVDSSVASIAANDTSAIIKACGHQPIVGYTYCRFNEGLDANNTFLTFISPITKEGRSLTIFRSGATPLTYGFLDDKEYIKVPWSALIDNPTFETFNDSFFGFRIRINWKDEDGNLRQTFQDGEIRLRVIKSGYQATPTRQDSNWIFDFDKFKVYTTTAGRSNVIPH